MENRNDRREELEGQVEAAEQDLYSVETQYASTGNLKVSEQKTNLNLARQALDRKRAELKKFLDEEEQS